jgi:DNA-binding response OmpR family regulator
MHILLIDDDRDFLFLFGNALKKAGFAVTPAPDGMQALQSLERKPADLVISDVVMRDTPVMSLTCLIKRAHPDVPLILISAYIDEPLIKNSLDLGADAFLPKPVNMNDLRASIARLSA